MAAGIRPAFQAAVANHYREDVFDTIVDENDEAHDEVPPLQSDEDIWSLIDDEATFFLREVEAEEPLPRFDVLAPCVRDIVAIITVAFFRAYGLA